MNFDDHMANPLMTLTEVANSLHCNQSTIYRLFKRGDIPAFKIGKNWLAFHHDIARSRGTANMIKLARQAKIPVRVFRE